MQVMLFGGAPSFAEIVTELRALERDINAMAVPAPARPAPL